ncbi:peptide chain release factor N(5)-glutamine methyltransferase [Pseudochrobactrum sp. HB0163]|uniref:peptide chain release factor N(5)-glutamine methyltransferase n=1 Tax=Pseudochrobactrum sp. HB0163 TaxID=3450708 RepID=UPI003F6E1F61
MTAKDIIPGQLGAFLTHMRLQLRKGDIESADIDARLLLQHFSGCSLTDLVVRADMVLEPQVRENLLAALQRRLGGEPVHRIIGERSFYGLTFTLNADTLEPRPDTETLVDMVLPFLRARSEEQGFADLLDMGTGTGALAVSLLHEVPLARAVAVDIADGALQAARINAARAGVSARFAALQSDWFASVRGKYDLIVSNPPYIPAKEIATLHRQVKDFDPYIALDGGADGLNFYRSLAQNCTAMLRDGGMVAVEIGAGQAYDVEMIFAQSAFRLTASAEDLAGHIRALGFQH